MKTADREMLWDVSAGSVAVLAFVISIEVTKLYHGHSGLTLDDALLLGYLLLSWIVLVFLRWLGFSGLGQGARLWMLLARELGSERRETVRSLSVVGVRNLRRPDSSTRGPSWTHLWCTCCRASGIAG